MSWGAIIHMWYHSMNIQQGGKQFTKIRYFDSECGTKRAHIHLSWYHCHLYYITRFALHCVSLLFVIRHFTRILHVYFIGYGSVMSLPQCYPEEYSQINHMDPLNKNVTTTKQNTAKCMPIKWTRTTLSWAIMISIMNGPITDSYHTKLSYLEIHT